MSLITGFLENNSIQQNKSMKSLFNRFFGKKDQPKKPTPPKSTSEVESVKKPTTTHEKISAPSETIPKPPIISEIQKIIGQELEAPPPGTPDSLTLGTTLSS